VIPAHAFGGSAYRVGGRGAFSAHRAWIVVSPDPAPDTGRDLEGAETVRAVLEAPPPGARHSTAGELGATLAPVVGAHCSTCEGLLWRRCTADTHESGHCPACDDGGETPCECTPPRNRVALIRGERYGAAMLVVLRELLHIAGAMAPVSAWVSRCAADAGRRVTVLRAGLLVVDIGGWRYALAPMVPHDSDDVVEVTL